MTAPMPALLSRRDELRRQDPTLVTQRSSVPGRQRWDVGIVRNRHTAARALEAELTGHPEIGSATANPLTGRVLVRHDDSVDDEQIGRWLRQAATRVADAIGIVSSASHRPAERTRGPDGPSPSTGTVPRGALALAAGAVAAAVLVPSSGPLLAVGAVAITTVAIVRRAWSQLGGDGSGRSPAENLSTIVGGRKAQVLAAAAISALGQLALLALSTGTTWGMMLLLTGENSLLTSLGVSGSVPQLAVLVGSLATLSVGVVALSYAAGKRWRRLGQDIERDWRESTFRHVQQAELRYVEEEGAGRITRIVVDDAAQLGRLFSSSGADVVQAATVALLLLPTLLLVQPTVVLAALLPVPVVAWMSIRFHRHNSENLAGSHAAGSALSEHLASRLDANATVKGFVAEEHEVAEVERLGEEARRRQAASARSSALYAETVQLGAISTMTAMLAVGGHAVLTGSLSFNVFSAIAGLPQNLIIRLPRLAPTLEEYQATVSALDRLQHLRALPAEALYTGARLEPREVRGELLLDAVTFAYPGRAPVLRDLTMRIAPRRVTAIVGATGSGKTTVAGLLVRFRDADSGRIRLDGTDLQELRLHDLREAIAFVSQEHRLFDGTVADNIRYGSFEATESQVVDAARRAAADGFIRLLPDGYETEIGQTGRTLSGGQRQRIALARALLKAAPIMILDEATSAVDNETEAVIQDALGTLAGSRTMIVIAHRLSTVRHADRIYVLDEGGVLAEAGTHDELVRLGGRYASLWRLQVGEDVSRCP